MVPLVDQGGLEALSCLRSWTMAETGGDVGRESMAPYQASLLRAVRLTREPRGPTPGCTHTSLHLILAPPPAPNRTCTKYQFKTGQARGNTPLWPGGTVTPGDLGILTPSVDGDMAGDIFHSFCPLLSPEDQEQGKAAGTTAGVWYPPPE